MAWDIYGEHLRPGYCEVHPDVPESYPCHLCQMEYDQRESVKQLEREAEVAMMHAYEEAMKDQYIELLHQKIMNCNDLFIDVNVILTKIDELIYQCEENSTLSPAISKQLLYHSRQIYSLILRCKQSLEI